MTSFSQPPPGGWIELHQTGEPIAVQIARICQIKHSDRGRAALWFSGPDGYGSIVDESPEQVFQLIRAAP